MSILVFVEQHDGSLVPSSLGVLAKGRELAGQLGTELVAVIVGSGITDVASSLGAYGVPRVLVADEARFGVPVAGPLVDAVSAAVRASGATLLLASASVVGAEVAGGIAGRFGVGVNTDGTDIRCEDGTITFLRPALDDTVVAECAFTGEGEGLHGVALFRANSFQPATSNGGAATVEQLDVPVGPVRSAEFLGVTQQQTGGVDITQADVLVAGGRGLGGPEHFDIVESLAKTLGGEVATTRAVVDAGWYDYSTQVGQTGKSVQPKLYVAVGISGAIQHKIGMQNSGTIVAINKDPNAPIFEFADFGVVGDLFQVLPKLEAALKARKGG